LLPPPQPRTGGPLAAHGRRHAAGGALGLGWHQPPQKGKGKRKKRRKEKEEEKEEKRKRKRKEEEKEKRRRRRRLAGVGGLAGGG